MAKARIIIADEDINYIFPFMQKIAEDFSEKIELEIITNEQYLNQFFSMPQYAEILIISEQLYNSSLLRHNIGNIFVMTEQLEEEQTAELNVNRIFKYTSVREIFNEILGKSSGTLKTESREQTEPQIVVVYSACGGVGKTTVALGISACLQKNYKRVLYINAERLQTFGRMLENKTSITATDVYAHINNPTSTIYQDIRHIIRKEGFSYLPPFKASLMSLGVRYEIFEKIAVSAKQSNEYDFIVIDADTTFDEEKAKLLNVADKVLVVTNQTATAVYASNILTSNINGVGNEKYIFLCNNFEKEKDNALISSDLETKFTISEYIGHFKKYEQMTIEELSMEKDMQKVAFLVI